MTIDTNLNRKDKLLSNYISKYKNVPMFSLVEINILGLCNRKCKFCPRYNEELYGNKDEYMDVKLYEKLMEDLKGINFNGTILFSGFSEPLLHPELEELIYLTKKYNPNTHLEIITNGDFATEHKIKSLMDKGLDTLLISLYDGEFQVKHFNDIKSKLKLKEDNIKLRKRYYTVEENFGIILSNRAGMISIDNTNVSPLKKPLKRSCYYPFYQVMIDYNGDVICCPHDWRKQVIVGSIENSHIFEIWNGDSLDKIRRSLYKKDRNIIPCKECDVKGVLIGSENFENWVKYYEGNK